MTKFSQILFFLLLFVCSTSIGQNYYFEKISPESGFAFDAVYTISEDCNGFVWFGCNNGLYYNNTSSIEKVNLYPESPSAYQSLKINKIYHDNNCVLWVCAESGLFKRNTVENSFSKIEVDSKDSLYTTTRFVENILQFDNDFYFIVLKGTLFYFNKNDMILHKVGFKNYETEGTITFIGKVSSGNVLIGNNKGQVFTGNNPLSDFEIFYDTEDDVVKTICEDNNKYYIGFINNGVEVINLMGKKLYELKSNLTGKYKLPDDRVREIIRNDNGEIWIGTYQGILVLGGKGNSLVTSKENTGLPHNSIYVLHKGRNNGIWVGTWAGGVSFYNQNNYRFNHIEKVPNESTEPKSVVSAFIQDNDGNIWIGSEQAGINLFSVNESKFLPYNKLFSQNELDRIKSLTTENGENIFIGTFHQGVWHYNNNYKTLKKLKSNVLSDATIISTMAYIENELWVGTRGARSSLLKYDFIKNDFISYSLLPDDLNNSDFLRVWKLMFDSAYRLWVCTDEGLFYKNKDEEKFYNCFENDTIHKLNHTMIYTVFEDTNGEIWIGTKGKGIFKYSPQSEELIQISDNRIIAKSDVFGIVQDTNKDIWLSTDRGIFRYNLKTNNTTSYSTFDGISGNQFNPNAAYSSKKGEVFFGSSNGFCFINPDIIKPNTVAPEIFLSKLLINNQPFTDEKGFFTNSLIPAEIKEIKLKHHQNTLMFGVVSNNFIKPEKNLFRYRLLNYENEWIEVAQNADIVFTKIPPGKYTLEVMGANNDNIWSKSPLSIEVEILAPIWLRWYALLIYFGITVFIVFVISKEIRLRINLRKEILAERYKGEAKEHIFAEKLRFFTNVSHEIRTPLTLIISPLDNLLKKFQYDDKTSKHLNIIKRNSSRLLRLTNQILDFRLLEVGKLKAHFQKTDIVTVCNEVFNCFELLIKEKQINFIFNSNYKSMWVTVDPDMIEKIIYNLVSNALKFSEEKGQVFLSIESNELTEESYTNYVFSGTRFFGKSIEIKVRDFGKGIKEHLLPTIMERFTTDPTEKETGTGIGLHLCQEYAKLNNGNVLVSSEEGKGSTFILNIPFQKNTEFEEKSIVHQFMFDNNGDENAIKNALLVVNENNKVILLAEDNDELRSYLKDFLSQYYKVLTAKNGQQAYEIANEVNPDILITDILMPVVDGLELIKSMKNNGQVNDIPIIVLTALSESKYQKESLLKGVDSFLTKPVDDALLLAQIENILSKRAMLTKRQQQSNGTQNETDLKSNKLSLIHKAENIVELNLRNSNFDLEVLLESLNISRSTLHRKIKSSTNQSPSEFIRDIRLKHAVKLMKSNTLNIDEIGTYVGFNSTSYFIRSFKKKYGKTPKEFYTSLNKQL